MSGEAAGTGLAAEDLIGLDHDGGEHSADRGDDQRCDVLGGRDAQLPQGDADHRRAASSSAISDRVEASVGPTSCTMVPSEMKTTRFACAAAAGSCVTRTTAWSCSRVAAS